MEKKAKNKGGRPTISVNWEEVNRLCAIQCTAEEIASVLAISVDTLSRRCVTDHKISFAEYIKKNSGEGKTSLRRAQFRLALNGNATMLVWLGKQYLGQTDKQEVTSSIDVRNNQKATDLTDDELAAIASGKSGRGGAGVNKPKAGA